MVDKYDVRVWEDMGIIVDSFWQRLLCNAAVSECFTFACLVSTGKSDLRYGTVGSFIKQSYYSSFFTPSATNLSGHKS